jgi:hypothetical protein
MEYVMRKRFVYLVGIGSAQYTPDGEEILIVYSTCATRKQAEKRQKRNPGTAIFKREAHD